MVTPKRTTLNRDKRFTFLLFTFPGFAIYTVFTIFPILLGIYYSLTNWNGFSPSYNLIGLKNYISLFSDKKFFNALLFNLKYSVGLIVGTVVISIFLAILLNNKFKGRTIFRTIYFLPAVLSMVTVSLIFNQIFYRVIPTVGDVTNISILSKNILGNKTLAIYGILFVSLWQGIALPTLLFLAGLQTIPTDLYEAASLDGANTANKFRFITMPYLLPTLSVVFVLTLKSGITVFDYIKSMTDGGPGGATTSIAMLIYNHGFEQNKFAYSIAEAIVSGLIITAISVIQIKFTDKKKVE